MMNYTDELAALVNKYLRKADFGLTTTRYCYANDSGMQFKGYYSGKMMPTTVYRDHSNPLHYIVVRMDEYGTIEPVGSLYLNADDTLASYEKAAILSREKTREEVQEEFINHIKVMINYWEGQRQTSKEKLDGLAFSILVALDGEACDLPGFAVAPMPSPDDKAYHMARDENYFPRNNPDLINCDIAGNLHEIFCQKRIINEESKKGLGFTKDELIEKIEHFCKEAANKKNTIAERAYFDGKEQAFWEILNEMAPEVAETLRRKPAIAQWQKDEAYGCPTILFTHDIGRTNDEN